MKPYACQLGFSLQVSDLAIYNSTLELEDSPFIDFYSVDEELSIEMVEMLNVSIRGTLVRSSELGKAGLTVAGVRCS